MRNVTHYAHFLPEKLDVQTTLDPEKRHRGIYDVVVYKGHIDVSASFPKMSELLPTVASALRWNEASLCMGISDLRSIKQQVSARVDGQQLAFEPGLPSNDLMASGLSVPFPLDSASLDRTFDLSILLELIGAEW